LIEAAGLIGDRQLASEYRSTLLDRFFATFRKGRGSTPAAPARSAVARVAFTGDAVVRERLRILTAILLTNPDLLPEVEDAWCRLTLPDDLHALRAGLLEFAATGAAPDGLRAWLDAHGLGDAARACLDDARLPVSIRARDDDLMPLQARQRWWHYYGFLNFERFQEDVHRDARNIGSLDAVGWAGLQARLMALEALRRGDVEPDP
ncbi:DNA primase, partial [Ameyamaea chiangmaiensis]|nr:DNA primase [Ameyamaea chiangmaiensis]